MTLGIKQEFAGYYKIEAVSEDGSRRLLADWFPNLILDQGLNRMGVGADYLDWCQVGSGSTAPVATQTSLVSRVAGTGTKQSDVSANSGSSPYYARRTITYRFGIGVAAGVLAEVGVAWASEGSLYSRALILDALGNPTTITVLATESLDVTYELRMYASVDATEGTITLKGVEHAVVQKTAMAASWGLNDARLWASFASDILGYSGTVSGAITGEPTGNLGAASVGTAAYSSGSLEQVFNITAGLTDWNDVAGIGAIMLIAGWGRWQIGFTPKILKTSSDVLTLQVRTSWGRKA